MTVATSAEPIRVRVPPLPVVAPRSWERAYVRSLVVVDAIAAAIAGAAGFAFAMSRTELALGISVIEFILTPLLWIAAIGLAGGYDSRFLGAGPEEYRRVALGAFGLIAAVGVATWATNAEPARDFVLVALPTAAVLTPLARRAMRRRVHRRRERGDLLHRTVIVGRAASVDELASYLSDLRHGFKVLGACTPDGQGTPGPTSVPVLGNLSSVVDVVKRLEADTVAVVSSAFADGEALRRLSWDLEPTGATLVVAPSLMEVAGPRLSVRPVNGLPLLHVEHPQFTGIRRLLKGMYDPLVASLALIVLSPVMLAIAIAIKMDSRGPVLFRQVRIGEMGREFTIFKFRTMVVNAEELKSSIAHLNEGAGPLFKARHDPRITRIGSWLRRTSLDELPQLINVVLGQMSLVGPRPHLPGELALFGEDSCRRLFVKPGLTGLWQISGRSDLSFEESVRLDLRYVENWTLTLDLYLMWRTLRVMVTKAGAY